MTALRVKQLTIAIGDHLVCEDFDLEMRAGEHWGVLGGNGAGKTTLLHTLAGLREPDRGEIQLEQQDLKHFTRFDLARKLGVLFQDSVDSFPSTVRETVLTGRHPHQGFWSWGRSADRLMAETALEQLQLLEMQYRQVDTLSGGERRRLAIATLFLQDPEIWLLDEPTNHLDPHHQIRTLDLIHTRIKQKNGVLLMVLHDVNLINRYCTHAVLMLPKNKTISGPITEVINKTSLELLYQHPVTELVDEKQGRWYFPA